MENGYPFSIFHFAFAMENTKWATEKSDKNDNAYPGPLAQLLVKLLLTANVGVRRTIMRIAYEDHILFNYLVKLHATPSGS